MENQETGDVYSIVSFEDGLSIIATCWAMYQGNTMTESFYPINISSQKIVKLLLARSNLSNENAKLLPIVQFHCYACIFH